MKYLFIWLFILFIGFRSTIQQCADNTLFGDTPSSHDDNTPITSAQTGYFLGGTLYEINCCGLLDSYEVYVDAAGDLTFQLWRPSGATFELIHQQTDTITSTTPTAAVIPLTDIIVQANDRWGWWTSGFPTVRYGNGAGCGGTTCSTDYKVLSSLSVGAFEAWGSTISDVRHAIQLTVNSTTSPSFTNLNLGVSISDSTGVGTTVYTVSYTDPDVNDVLTVSMTANAYFSFNATNGNVSVGSSLLAATSPITLTFSVADQCSTPVTGTLTVTLTNLPPVINNLNNFTELSEDSTGEVLVFSLDVTDPDGSSFTCSLDSAGSSPASSGTYFNVRLKTASTDWAIYTQTSAVFDYSTIHTFSLQIQCIDHRDSVTGTFNVYILANEPPYLTNLPYSSTLSATAAIGTTVYSVQATDTNPNDTLTFSIQCDPSSCPFTLLQTGAILLNSSISSTTTIGYDVSATVSDGRSSSSIKVLTVLITDINEAPEITNLDTSFSVAENSALGLSIVSTFCNDANTNDVLTYTMTCTPASGLTYFDIGNSDGVISTSSSSSINYETIATAGSTTFACTVACSDGQSSSTKPVNMTVIDVNEAPVFGQSQYSISANESAAGTIIRSSGFTVLDEDIGDTSTFSLDCGTLSQFFTINTATGVISFASDYDVDDGIRASAITCNVTATDSAGLTTAAGLSIAISDVNDNAPTFTQNAYAFTILDTVAVGTAVGSVNATDGDITNAGAVIYSLDQSTLGDDYFEISTTGELTVKTSVTALGSPSVAQFKVLATDTAGSQTETNVTVLISDTSITSVTSTTERHRTFFEEPKNIPWFMACCVVVALIIIACIYVICTKSPSPYTFKCCKVRKGYNLRRRVHGHRR